MGINHIGVQFRECIKHLKTFNHKAKDGNSRFGNFSSTCPFYKEFDQALTTAPRLQPAVFHDIVLNTVTYSDQMEKGQQQHCRRSCWSRDWCPRNRLQRWKPRINPHSHMG